MDDSELVARAKYGDVPAYEELVGRYQEIAFRTAYLMNGDAEAAKDAAQAGFIKAYYALNRFHAEAPFRPWLLRIVANEARNAARSAHRRVGYELRLVEDTRNELAHSPEAVALAGLTRATLLGAVLQLPEKDQQVIRLRYFLELSEAEMADALGCARGTVKSRLSRALDRLREVLSHDRSELMDEEMSCD